MDGLFHGKPYEQMDDFGLPGYPYFWKHPNDGLYTHQTFQVPKMEVLTYISCM